MRPLVVPRPGHQEERRRRRATSDDLKRMFGHVAVYRPKEVTGGN